MHGLHWIYLKSATMMVNIDDVFIHQKHTFDVNMRQNKDFTSQAVLDALASLGARIRRARKARKLSLTQLEQITRLHRTTLGRLELGDPGVSVGTFASVLEALQELAETELLLSRPETPRQQRGVSVPVLDQDF
ncbi:helix-turn-helix domain-containing protein [Herbaspirillum sp. WKF16]|uniref:helix-turn-helix domain-containing protein n=1 Tax=Herbaspirillum sp. WKF16 TaxID=3028312 RepID=UPI0023A96356|nr:helix-turn-helix domain-containing protein [Herbaspirillum sp. WKF16]WDZ96216.1 helix-turn-helix domain-containing protein [Herbaspirillum sp. WKF16]